MKKTYQAALADDCINIAEQIDNILSAHMPKDLFCELNREILLRDIQSNILIQRSPAIVCIVEYATRSYLYVSENIASELEITAEELVSGGLGRALLNFDPNHRKVFLDTFYPKIFEHYEKFAPLNEAKDLHVSYNTKLINKSGVSKWYHHQLSVLACNENGFPCYALKFLTNIDELKKDDILSFQIHKKLKNKEPRLVYSKDVMSYEYDNSYSPREKEILHLIDAGYSTKAIADTLSLSEFTVSTHRKNIAKKMKMG